MPKRVANGLQSALALCLTKGMRGIGKKGAAYFDLREKPGFMFKEALGVIRTKLNSPHYLHSFAGPIILSSGFKATPTIYIQFKNFSFDPLEATPRSPLAYTVTT